MPSFDDLYHLRLKSLGEAVTDWTKTIDDTPSGRRFFYVNKTGQDGFRPVEEVFA